MRILTLLVILGIAAGTLFATVPNRTLVGQEIEALLVEQIDAMDPEAAQDDVTRLLLTTCKLGRSGCARLIGSLIEMEYQNKIFFSTVTLRLGNGDPMRCYGILNKAVCPSL